MATLNIPVSDTLSSYDQRVVLDGREYTFRFQWNQREAKWYMDLFDSAGDVIVYGIKLVCNFPLLRRLTDVRAPPGEMWAMDRSGTDADPGLTELGSRVLLVYIEAADIVAAFNG